jgi:hypothetical protein
MIEKFKPVAPARGVPIESFGVYSMSVELAPRSVVAPLPNVPGEKSK